MAFFNTIRTSRLYASSDSSFFQSSNFNWFQRVNTEKKDTKQNAINIFNKNIENEDSFFKTRYSEKILTSDDENKETQQKTNCVLGRGHIAKIAVLTSLNKGEPVVQLVRNKSGDNETKITSNGPLTTISTPQENFTNPKFFKRVFEEHNIEGSVINGIGIPNGSKKCMEVANVLTPQAVALGLHLSGSGGHLIHFSSSAAAYFDEGLFEQGHRDTAYFETKQEGENVIKGTGLERHSFVRLPYVINSIEPGVVVHIDNNHGWACEHLVAFRTYGLRIPCIGSGKQTIPIVMSGDVKKVISKLMQNPSPYQQKTINATGQYLSQAELLDRYAEFMGVDGKKMHIPLSVAYKMATLFPYGHLQPYAIRGLEIGENLSERDIKNLTNNSLFIKAIGEPETLQESFARVDESQTVTFSTPPFKEHCKTIPGSMISLMSSFWMYR